MNTATVATERSHVGELTPAQIAAAVVGKAVEKYSAFEALASKNSAVVAHKITPKITQTATGLNVEFTFEQLAGCRASKTSIDEKTGNVKGGNLGFMCEPIVFDYNGHPIAMKPGWVSISPVQK